MTPENKFQIGQEVEVKTYMDGWCYGMVFGVSYPHTFNPLDLGFKIVEGETNYLIGWLSPGVDGDYYTDTDWFSEEELREYKKE